MVSQASLAALQEKIWKAQLPLEIRISPSECRTYDQCDTYLISVPRLSYLPPLLPRLLDFFLPSLITPPSTPYEGYFTFSNVPLKWHLPIGLLHDIYASPPPPRSTNSTDPQTFPFPLTLHFTPTAVSTAHLSPLTPYPGTFHDSFINAAKEADFLRSGTARPIMSLPEASSRALFSSVGSSATSLDFPLWKKVMAELIPRDASAFRSLPLRVYLPTSPLSAGPPTTAATTSPSKSPTITEEASGKSNPPEQPSTNTSTGTQAQAQAAGAGQIKTLQLSASNRARAGTGPGQTQQNPVTLGQALNSLLPGLFPSRRTPVHARPVLHGAPVPMAAPLEELVRWAGYADGWLGVVVVLL